MLVRLVGPISSTHRFQRYAWLWALFCRCSAIFLAVKSSFNGHDPFEARTSRPPSLIHLPIGTAKPCLDRWSTSGGNTGSSAFFNRYFVSPFRTLYSFGIFRAKLTRSVSRNGERASKECIMLARSIL